MNPIHAAAAAAAIVVSRRKCPSCRARLEIVRERGSRRYQCKKCGHPFTARELASRGVK